MIIDLTTELYRDVAMCNPWNGDIKQYLLDLSSGVLDFDFYTTFYARKSKLK